MDTDVIKKKIDEIAADPQSAFILIDKPIGEPSFRTISQLRQITGQKRIGFAGTLDPAASGLLVIGFNKATKLLDVWHQFGKEYEAEITLGQVSTTYDREGEITTPDPSLVRRGDTDQISLDDIKNTLKQFIGNIEQLPPMYSAKSVAGERLYNLARQGKEIERSKQKVQIHSIDTVAYTYPLLCLKITCSTGTYIRSLAHDLGQVLGCGAYLSALRRTAIGPYKVSQAQKMAQIEGNNWRDYWLDLTAWQEQLNLGDGKT